MRNKFPHVIDLILAIAGLTLDILAFAGIIPIAVGIAGLAIPAYRFISSFRKDKK